MDIESEIGLHITALFVLFVSFPFLKDEKETKNPRPRTLMHTRFYRKLRAREYLYCTIRSSTIYLISHKIPINVQYRLVTPCIPCRHGGPTCSSVDSCMRARLVIKQGYMYGSKLSAYAIDELVSTRKWDELWDPLRNSEPRSADLESAQRFQIQMTAVYGN
jgi:hypothetical protein